LGIRVTTNREVFVFGSNLAGRHGAGSAKEALKNWGARWGCGFGLSGNSFAIPTKDDKLNTLPLPTIGSYIEAFHHFARVTPAKYLIVDIGCGLAGYKPEDIATFFKTESSDRYTFLGKLHEVLYGSMPRS
jgi:hypothetical protein